MRVIVGYKSGPTYHAVTERRAIVLQAALAATTPDNCEVVRSRRRWLGWDIEVWAQADGDTEATAA